MVRTQIYLTEAEHAALRSLAAETGRTQSELIRDAVDGYLAEQSQDVRVSQLAAARGIWAQRDDLPDFASVRRELERDVGQ